MRLVIPFLLLATSAPAVAADQFDLACQGYKWTQRSGAGEAYSFRVRVDLAAGKWCEGECQTVQGIVSASEDRLVLIDEGTLNTRLEMAREASFDRKANAFHYRYLQSRPTEEYLEYQATCTSGAFTPLPAG